MRLLAERLHSWAYSVCNETLCGGSPIWSFSTSRPTTTSTRRAGDVGLLRSTRAAHPHGDTSPRGASDLPLPVERGQQKTDGMLAPRRASGHFAGLSYGGRRRDRPGTAAGPATAGRRSRTCGRSTACIRAMRVTSCSPTRRGTPSAAPSEAAWSERAREDALRINLYEKRPRPLGLAGFASSRLARREAERRLRLFRHAHVAVAGRCGHRRRGGQGRQVACGPPRWMSVSAEARCCCSGNRRRRRASSG